MPFPVLEHVVILLPCTLQQLGMEASCGVKHVIRSKSEAQCMLAMASKTLCHLCGGHKGDLTGVQAIAERSRVLQGWQLMV